MKNITNIGRWLFTLLLTAVAGITRAQEQSVFISSFDIEAGATKTVPVVLTAADISAIYGVQSDITMPEGLIFEALAPVDNTLSLTTNTLQSRATRFALLSLAGATIPKGQIATLTVKAAANFAGGQITFSNTRFTISTAGEEIAASGTRADVSLATPQQQLYAITTVAEHGYITIDGNKTSAAAGETVKFRVVGTDGWAPYSFEVKSNGQNVPVRFDGGTVVFDMPAAPVTITGIYKQWHTYTVSSSDKGTVTVTLQGRPEGQALQGDVLSLSATPNDGYAFGRFSVTTAAGESVEVNTNDEDSYFTMPDADVTISASFLEVVDAVYIETDLTGDFPVDWQGWEGATGFVTWAAPEVATNDGRQTPACERYDGSVVNTGIVFSRTLQGLPNGLYTIELYGAAAYTPGRGFQSDLVEGDETAVYLYAQTPAGIVKQYIPAHIAENFNGTGLATAVLQNVQVTDGTVTIGMYKDKGLTNWHVVQIKGVTALVDAASALALAVAEAQEMADATIPSTLKENIQNVISEYNTTYETGDEYLAAIEAIEAARLEAEPFIPLGEVLNEAALLSSEYKSNSPAEAGAAYDAVVYPIIEQFQAATIEDFEAAIAAVNDALTTLAKAQNASGSDLTSLIINPMIDGTTEGWTCELPKGGGGPMKPSNDALEYWAGSANPRNEAAFDYYQVIEGLPVGYYTLSAEMFNSLNGEDGAVFAPTSGLYAASSDGEVSVLVDTEGDQLIPYTTPEILVTDGTLRIGVKSFDPVAARWFVVDNFGLMLSRAIDASDINYERALSIIKPDSTYRIFAMNEVGQKFYLNTAGTLISEVAKAGVFKLAPVVASGTLYETGWNLGYKFTNPTLSNGSTGDIVQNGRINVSDNQDRNDWERQVFLYDGNNFAVRSTNANSENWGANTFWDVIPTETELPNAGYSLEPAYKWQIERYDDKRKDAVDIVDSWIKEDKLQVVSGLVTDAEQWFSNAKEPTEGSYEALLDNNYATFFHSAWSVTVEEPHYLQAELPEPIDEFYFYFKKRSQNNNNRPTAITISASADGVTFTDITALTEGLPTDAAVLDYLSGKISLGAEYKYIRFTPTATNSGSSFFTFSECRLFASDIISDVAYEYLAKYFRLTDYSQVDEADIQGILDTDATINLVIENEEVVKEALKLADLIETLKTDYINVEDTYEGEEAKAAALDALADVEAIELTTVEEVKAAEAQVREIALQFFGNITPVGELDVTDWFIVNPTPVANKAVAPGWEGDTFGDSSSGVSEYWNKAAATFHQTITLPAGSFKLTAEAFTRTGMEGTLFAGENTMAIETVESAVANTRAQGADYFEAGNGLNTLLFVTEETTTLQIGLTADAENGDHWTVWRGFHLYLYTPTTIEETTTLLVEKHDPESNEPYFETVTVPEAGVSIGVKTNVIVEPDVTLSDTELEEAGVNSDEVRVRISGYYTVTTPGQQPASSKRRANSSAGQIEFTVIGEPGQKVVNLRDAVPDQYFIKNATYTFTIEEIAAGVQDGEGSFSDIAVKQLEEPQEMKFVIDSTDDIDDSSLLTSHSSLLTPYDLSGRRVQQLRRGQIYVIDGKKVAVK